MRKYVDKLVSAILGGVIGFTSFGIFSHQTKNNNHIKSNVAVLAVNKSENEENSEQYYRTKTGKCYHKAKCSCLCKSKILLNDGEIEEFDLKPCSKCC